MSAVRASRAALRARSALTKNPVQRRGYADAVSDKIKLSLALPHQVRLKLCGFQVTSKVLWKNAGTNC